MKRAFKTALFCFIPLFVFSFCALAAGDPRLLTAKSDVRENGVKSGEKFRDASGASVLVGEKYGAKTGSAASEVKAQNGKDGGIGYTEFDDFNNVSDPLYREGSKALLEEAIEEDNAPKTAVKKISIPAKHPIEAASGGKLGLMRDAPSDIPAVKIQTSKVKAAGENIIPVFPVKKNRLIKLIPADPIKTKSTL